MDTSCDSVNVCYKIRKKKKSFGLVNRGPSCQRTLGANCSFVQAEAARTQERERGTLEYRVEKEIRPIQFLCRRFHKQRELESFFLLLFYCWTVCASSDWCSPFWLARLARELVISRTPGVWVLLPQQCLIVLYFQDPKRDGRNFFVETKKIKIKSRKRIKICFSLGNLLQTDKSIGKDDGRCDVKRFIDLNLAD